MLESLAVFFNLSQQLDQRGRCIQTFKTSAPFMGMLARAKANSIRRGQPERELRVLPLYVEPKS